MKINDLKTLKAETEHLKAKISADKELLLSESKLLKYHLFEDVFNLLGGLFKQKKNQKKEGD